MTRHSDPRSGEEMTRLININRAEPDATLFQVPAGYQIVEGPESKADVVEVGQAPGCQPFRTAVAASATPHPSPAASSSHKSPPALPPISFHGDAKRNADQVGVFELDSGALVAVVQQRVQAQRRHSCRCFGALCCAASPILAGVTITVERGDGGRQNQPSLSKPVCAAATRMRSTAMLHAPIHTGASTA